MSIPRLVIPIDWLDWCMGVSWPQGDEDGMRQIRDAWKQCAIDVLTAGGAGGDVTGLVNGAVNSASADEFTAYWNKHVAAGGILDQLGQQCAATANYADMAATQIEATKISMNIVALLMYWEFIQAMIEIAATFGFGTPAVAVQLAAEEFATREALIMLAKSLLKAMEFTVLPDLVSEVWEAIEHHNMDFIDWNKLGHDFEHGLVLGAFFAIPGLGGQLASKVPGLRNAVQFASEHNPFTRNIFTKTAGSLLYAGSANVAGNALTWAVDQGVQAAGAKDWAKDSQGPFANWQQAFVNGVFMSGVHTGAEGIKNHYGDPKLGVTTTEGDNLLLRTRGGSDIGGDGKTDGLFVFDHTDKTRDPVYQGRGTVNPATGEVTVTKDGVQTTYQGLQVHTLDKGQTQSTVTYTPQESGGYRPETVTFHGGGESGLPANHSVQYDPVTEEQTGVAVRGTGQPGTGPAHDPLGVQVAPGSVHVFDSTASEPARVSVAGGGDVTPVGFNRPIGPHETAVYGYDGKLHEVYSYPGGDTHGVPPEQVPQPGFQAVYNADGTFRGIEPQNTLSRPEPITDPALIAAAHQRASQGVIREFVPPEHATSGTAAQPEPRWGSAEQPAVPGAVDPATVDGQNQLERVRQEQQQRQAAAQQAADDQQLTLFDSLLNNRVHESLAGQRSQEQTLVGAGALTAAAVATAHTGVEAPRAAGGRDGNGNRWFQDPIPGTVSPHEGLHDWNPRLGDRYHSERAALIHGVDENGRPYVQVEGRPERYPNVHAAAESMLHDFADQVRAQYGDLLEQPTNHIGRALANLYTAEVQRDVRQAVRGYPADGHPDVRAAVERVASAPDGARQALAELLYNPPENIRSTLRQVLDGNVHDARALAEVLDWFENPGDRAAGLHFPYRDGLGQHERKAHDRFVNLRDSRLGEERFADLLDYGIGTPEQTRTALRYLLTSDAAERRGFREMLDTAQDGPIHTFDDAAPTVAAVAVVSLGGRDLVVLHTSRKGAEQVEHEPFVQAHLDMVEQQLHDQRAQLEDRLLDRHEPGTGARATERRQLLQDLVDAAEKGPQKGEWSKELNQLNKDRSRLLTEAKAEHPNDRAELERIDKLLGTLGKCGEVGALDEAARLLTSWMPPEDIAAGRDFAILDEAFQNVTFHSVTVGAHGIDVIAEHQPVTGGRPHAEQIDACPNCASVLTAMGGHEPGRSGLERLNERILQRAGVHVDTGHAPVPGARPHSPVRTSGEAHEKSPAAPSRSEHESQGTQSPGPNKFAALLGSHDPAARSAGPDASHPHTGGHDPASAAPAADRQHTLFSWDPVSRPENHYDYRSQLHWAQEGFNDIQHATHDVAAIHEALRDLVNPDGTPRYPMDRLQRVKNHLFVDKHHLDDGHGGIEEEARHFDADPDVVQSWLRLAAGTPEPHDLLLLDHELAEAAIRDADPSISHGEAHRAANEQWDYESALPSDERRGLNDYFEGNHGDPGVLPEGRRGLADDPLSLGRGPGRDGQGTGHGEGDRNPAAGPGAADDPAHGRRPQDLQTEGDHRHLAGAGDDRQLGAPGAGHGDPAPAGESGRGRPLQSGAAFGWHRGRGADRPGGREAPAPFAHQKLVAADRETWNRRVTDFEVAMGAADFHDPAVRQSIADTVVALRDALLVLNDPLPGESRADYERRIESVFFRNDPTSAGNVGFDVSFAELLEHGDPRELMTAAWNAAYINAKPVYEENITEASSLYDPSYLNSPRTEVLGESLMRAAESHQTDRMRLAGIDPEKVADRLKWQDSQARDLARRAELSGPIKRFSGANDERIFARDFFSTSAVVMEAADRMRTGISILLSKVGMTPREGDAQLPFVHTAQDYADMNAPVGELSKRYLQPHMDGPIDDPTVKLPWREGLALHDKNNSWTKMVEDRGMTKVDGVSPTTSKMLLLGDILGFDRTHQDQFLKGLMAWMLPSRDHSLPEIVVGAQMLDLGPLRGHPVKMDSDPVTFYQRALDWHTQSGPALDMAVPHREHYVDLIDRGELTELTQNTDLRGEVPDLVRSVRQQLTSGVVTDIHPGEGESAMTTLHSWLERHGVDPQDRAAVQELAAKIPEADLYAIGAYTLHMHPYMTAAVTVHGMADAITGGHSEGLSRLLFDKGVNSYINHYLEDLAEGKLPARLPMALRPVFHEGDRLTAASPKSDNTQRWLDAHRRLQEALADPGTSRSVTKALNQELEQARNVIGELVEPHLQKLFDEVLTHCDMVQGALTNLPTVGTPDQPVWAFRGDGLNPMARVRYGVTARSTKTARQFISTSLEHGTALLFVKDNNPLYVAYRLTGQYARDISAFTVYKDTPEVLLPLGAVTRRVTDPALIEEARQQIPWDRLPPGTSLIVMEEVPHA